MKRVIIGISLLMMSASSFSFGFNVKDIIGFICSDAKGVNKERCEHTNTNLLLAAYSAGGLKKNCEEALSRNQPEWFVKDCKENHMAEKSLISQLEELQKEFKDE